MINLTLDKNKLYEVKFKYEEEMYQVKKSVNILNIYKNI